ncbi:hypothetical protein SAMN05421837_101204 [Amycolatopsis pretoriensis]|uniref:Uncharacterized protein n=1 Tax=Amycolatopsis pretoriensis TaxID=218821 RepID=A0A1H5Q3P9_9PSEU|nr:hypothetical protein [Amycolatopsis pretoriensis]SEF20041.1 hypothetical protein SAMN05421837_101204 [Amycolatopsis pretoriensis]
MTPAEVVLRERQGRDRGWWDRMRACYAPDAAVRLSCSGAPGRSLSRDRGIPSYRFLAQVLGHRGYPVPDDLYGDDRPDGVAELYDTLLTWLPGKAS